MKITNEEQIRQYFRLKDELEYIKMVKQSKRINDKLRKENKEKNKDSQQKIK